MLANRTMDDSFECRTNSKTVKMKDFLGAPAFNNQKMFLSIIQYYKKTKSISSQSIYIEKVNVKIK